MGVSPRRLRGWEPAEVTTFFYEGDRLVRSVTVREPEFSAEDLAVLASHVREERVPRGSHGHPLAEAMSEDANPQRRDAKYRYVVPLPVTDFAQQALNVAQKQYQDEWPDADLSGLRWTVEKVQL